MLSVPVFDTDQPGQAPRAFENKVMGKDDIMDELGDIVSQFPSMPTFEALRLYFSSPIEVCPTSLIDDESLMLLETEQACREYYQLPYKGGLWDQPKKLLEVFNLIRQERNQYERARMDQISKKKPSKSSRDETTLQSPNLDLPPRNSNLDI